MNKIASGLSLSFLLGAAFSPGVTAQEITGTPGSPSATTTIDGNQLPPLPPKFGGEINESAKDSTTLWPPRVVPPKGAPNVLLIMTDDQGYGVSGTFGGVIPTLALDRIAARIAYVYAVALKSAGRLGEAMTTLKDSLARHPDDRDTLLAIVSFSRDAGDFGTALEFAESLARISTTDPNLAGLIEDLRRQARKPDAKQLPDQQ